MEMLIIFIDDHFLRYYVVMQQKPVVEKINGDEERAHGSFQLVIT